MKKICTTILILAFSLMASAQHGMFGPKVIKDWSGVTIPENTVFGVAFVLADVVKLGGLSYEDRCDVDPDLEEDYVDLVKRGIGGMSGYIDRNGMGVINTLNFTRKTEGRSYIITFLVRDVDKNGNTSADVLLTTPSGIKCVIKNLYGKGGKYGSFVNLMGDGYESLGYEFAKQLHLAFWHSKIKTE